MTDAEVYRRAAERVMAQDIGCCYAIWAAVYRDLDCGMEDLDKRRSGLREAFEIFRPKPSRATAYYWWDIPPPNDKEPRMLALCLAAAMAEAGDL